MREAGRRGARFVGPNEPELIEGVGTYALEIAEDVPGVDVVIVPVGSGSGAAALRLRDRLAGREVVVVLSVGNLAPAELPEILAAGSSSPC